MPDTPWATTIKNYLQEGEFTATTLTSIDRSTIDAGIRDIGWDGTWTFWCGIAADKLYAHVGQFTTTEVDSSATNPGYGLPFGIEDNGDGNTVFNDGAGTLVLIDGVFGSTVLASRSVSAKTNNMTGISAMGGAFTPWCEGQFDKLYLQDGQFDTTVADSESVGAVDSVVAGISWNGENSLWAGDAANKLYMQTGQFESTLVTSRAPSVGNGLMRGISTNNVDGRLGVGAGGTFLALLGVG